MAFQELPKPFQALADPARIGGYGVRIEVQAGHGEGRPMSKVIGEMADKWAFAAHWTGLKVQTPQPSTCTSTPA